ncbi:TonB-dependent receptor [Solitalea longa]|uniref:TonB-dependent receptor n=1 Tax=Solitalea longa TaxID=2079460 RepID=A0A2S5A0W0_9SPHI|nr:TonB-dependent receptor [Solitalea longa]POY36228.1 TonB-dependent receptor [Solitalea longa]
MNKFLLASLALFGTVGVQAQNSTNTKTTDSLKIKETSRLLNEVTVTEMSNKNKSAAKLALADIKRGQGVFMDDAINTSMPGVLMMRRSVSGGQQFNVRGYGNGLGIRGANNNFDSQGLKMYLNGIPVTDAEGVTIMDDIDFGSISNVEVLKGPAGSSYGFAIAGVVNMQTQKAELNKVSIGQNVMVGDFGLRRYTTSLQVGGSHSSILVNYGKQLSDGFMPHNESTKDFVNIVGDFQLSEKQKISSYLGYANSYDERAGELTVDQYNKKDYSGNPSYIKNNAHSEIIGYRFGLGHSYAFNKYLANTTSVFGSSNKNTASSAGGWTDKSPVNVGIRSAFDLRFNVFGRELSGTAGIEAQQQTYESIGYNMVANNLDPNGYNLIGSMKSNMAVTSKTYNAFTEWNLKLPFMFDFSAGLSLSTMDNHLEDRFYNAANNTASPETNKPSAYGVKYSNLVSPRIALNRSFGQNFSAYASYSVGYRAPVSGNLFIPYTGKINTDLKPEKGSQYEIGAKGSLLNNRLAFQVALFNAVFSDKMSSVSVANAGNTATLYSYLVNSGSQDNKGAEVMVKYLAYQSSNGLFKTVQPFANLTYNDFKYDNYQYQSSSTRVVADYSGLAVAGVAPLTYNLGVDAATKYGVYANVNYNYRDAMPITSDGAFKTKSFDLLNAKLGYQRSFLKNLMADMYVGANNIMGTQYYNMVFINQMPDAYIPGPDKINYYGGVNLKYTF